MTLFLSKTGTDAPALEHTETRDVRSPKALISRRYNRRDRRANRAI